MTPIGHFMCSSAVAGNVDIITKKETSFCFLYYVFFLSVFYITTLFASPGSWAMHLHDQFGNVALIFFLIYWSRKEERKQFFVCLLIGGQILSAYTHIFDVIFLWFGGTVPIGMWRPHNIFHTPLAALVVPIIFLPLVSFLLKNYQYKKILFFLVVGYLLHIFADTITYNFQIYPLWPLSSFHFSLVDFMDRPDYVGALLGNPLYVFSESSKENIDGFIVYKSEILVNFCLMGLFFIKSIADKILNAKKVKI